ncbi:16S rRNA (adenine(1518)-N(6)/adenine(1519)-N(6))-dimethyltransferase RsmA [Tenuifilum thalassicum]|uniref:Ribosomal RNA small subunit methyltransferase A n=1 Tax=Tenuifilum thalassicum TaxID=2590900 RepID=A0A7D4BYS9_9BACT|nr:16S rRNA (adenine(1518)-N(6)/adenine(1519)-N(6))-dimethyltransferase RsmA [Tenuifilum thalassicum]QKG79284.1 16S rRNA (adenine(1518)-N(6)/adenine(1519)-N(6))-dimethyltransferase RsmA [Tenuifilum thalassicum]
MPEVRPKKHLGQHFLNDKRIANRIVDSLTAANAEKIVEIGPGMGVLTFELFERFKEKLVAVEVDGESVEYLNKNIPELNIIEGDFLEINLLKEIGNHFSIIGNLPYNISSQIFFKILEHREHVPEVVAMVQREVAQRIAEKPGSRTYGILSVLLQAYYNIEYLFTVSEGCFTPPPKVKSAVVRLTRNGVTNLGCDYKLFERVVKAAFNQRRKTLRNAIKARFNGIEISDTYAGRRAEQLSVEQFVDLTNEITQLTH